MEKLENLELVDVTFEDKKAVLVFLDEERGEIREVNFNKQVYDNDANKFVDNEDKAAKVEEWCQEQFNLTYDRLAEAIGERRDIYAYDNFNSLFEVKMLAKFDKDMVGQIMEIEITEVEDDGRKISIQFEYEGDTYESKMQYADYMEAKKQWFTNPIKRKKQYDKFEDKFGIKVEDREQLVGQKAMIEIKLAFSKFVFVEIKPFPKKKK